MVLNVGWEQFEAYLVIEGKQAKGSMSAHKSRFQILKRALEGKEFNRDNFNQFIYELKKTDHKPSYLNGFIKTVKHLARLLKTPEFEDYVSFDENLSPPQDTLTPKEITKLAEVAIKYKRYKDKKKKIKVLIYFLGLVGSRISETLALEWTDLSEAPIPMVHFRSEITKTKKERYCALPGWLYKMIQQLPRSDTRIFTRIDDGELNQDLKKRAEKCGIQKRVYNHLFRDSSINNKLFFGVPLEQVTSYHGHASTETTYKYYVRIQAKDLAQTLYNLDPSFRQDQTYDVMCQAAKEGMEKIFNPMLCDFLYESREVNGKKETIIRLIEK